ncbi:foldase [Petrotoga miotherma DSM 10691]|uniref:Foldase n=2 Tax=Petrotoga TaxID=28236 RepID=A0A2K1PE86_9BACT|nr:peptidylprolyl isomerase [Petrotoga miotherma]PNS01102.1 foldase [Petrotoga miotherma DSM 10691]
MNNWFKKHERLITIIVIAGFLAGIVWWSVATYVSSRNPATTSQNRDTLRKEDSVLVITKDGIDLDYPYWIMKSEVDNITQQQAQIYQQYYGQQLDPIFDYLTLDNQVVDLLFDEKIVRYYAEQNDLLPSKEEVNNQVNTQVDQYISQYKSDESNWDNMLQYYGSEQNIRNILISSLQQTVETDLINSAVKDAVAPTSREDALAYIEQNFESIKNDYEEVRVQHILFSDEATANSIKEKIETGEITFEDAASLYSKDTSNATNSGEIGWIKHGQYEKSFEDAAFNGQVGEIIGPVQTSEGFHLIRVLDRKIFEKPEDIFLYDDVYAEVESTVQGQKYDNWLSNYKESENFGRNYYDTKLMYMYELTKAGTDVERLEELAKELESIVFEGNEISMEVDSDYLAVYTMVVSQLMGLYNEQTTSINQYLSLSEFVDPAIVSLGLDAINNKLEELNAQSTTDESTSLSSEISKYQDAKSYLSSKESLEALGVSTTEDASVMRAELQTKSQDYTEKLKKVLADLYAQYPSSNTVVQLYYQLNPQDPKVKVSYSKLQLDQLKQYASYLGSQYLFSYFQQQITEILVNVQTVVDATQAATDTKLEALDVGLDLTDLLGLKEIKLSYLETIKKIDPNYYTNIDSMIESVQKEIEEANNTSNTSTDTSQVATPSNIQ